MSDNKKFDIADLRREYTQGGLRRRDLSASPSVLFKQWLQQAIDAGLSDATAMSLATVDAQGQPYQRIVLLKHFDDQGLVFYTNLGSRKAQQLAGNPKASVLFPWHMLERQVMFTGVVETLSRHEVESYFHSRPVESQIGAWVSQQSAVIADRAVLEDQYHALKQQYASTPVPLPEFWGGYRVRFDSVEFWQGGEHRLHDRFLYQQTGEQWNIDRLAP